MKNKQFMEQTANQMSVSELAEAIKLKPNVLRTEEFKVGDILEQFGSGLFEGESPIVKVTRIEGHIIWHIHSEGDKERECQDIKNHFRRTNKKFKPKAIWTDITKKCEFKLREDGHGFVLTIYEKHHFIGHLGLEGFYIPGDDYKTIMNGPQFKILKRGE